MSSVSPSSAKSPKIDYSAAYTCEVTAKQIISWHDKWNLAQNRGLILCKQIENVKRRALESKDPAQSLFPPELHQICDNLRIICSVFEDIIKNVTFAKSQIDHGMNLPNFDKDAVRFKTWCVKNMFEFLEEILKAYEEEYKIKKIVMGQFLISIKYFFHSIISFNRKYCSLQVVPWSCSAYLKLAISYFCEYWNKLADWATQARV